MKLFRHEGEDFIGFQCETREERQIVCAWLDGRFGKTARINGCNHPDDSIKVAITFHPTEDAQRE